TRAASTGGCATRPLSRAAGSEAGRFTEPATASGRFRERTRLPLKTSWRPCIRRWGLTLPARSAIAKAVPTRSQKAPRSRRSSRDDSTGIRGRSAELLRVTRVDLIDRGVSDRLIATRFSNNNPLHFGRACAVRLNLVRTSTESRSSTGACDALHI